MTIRIKLHRYAYLRNATAGELLLPDATMIGGHHHLADTLEDGRGISDACIPEGTYNVIWKNHPKHGYCFEVLNVPGRTGILFHAGNNITDTTGCILVGQVVGGISVALRDSLRTMTEFNNRFSDEGGFLLDIVGPSQVD